MSAYTAEQIEAVLGVKRATLLKWAQRGKVRRVARGLYDEDSVLQAWRKTAALTNT